MAKPKPVTEVWFELTASETWKTWYLNRLLAKGTVVQLRLLPFGDYREGTSLAA